MVWAILFLIPKENTVTRGIGLLETLWKVLDELIDTCLCTILQMHDFLHRFRAGRGMGTAIMDLKHSQEIASIDQDPLFLVFLDFSKAYDTVDRDRLLITLEGYGAVPQICGLLETFWDCQQVVPRHNGFHRPAFPTTRGTMLGRLVFPTMFNVVVDNVIKTWLAMMVEDQRVAHEGLVETIGQCLGVFYAKYGMFRSRDLDWLHHMMNVLVGLFKRYGLAANVVKSCTMTY